MPGLRTYQTPVALMKQIGDQAETSRVGIVSTYYQATYEDRPEALGPCRAVLLQLAAAWAERICTAPSQR